MVKRMLINYKNSISLEIIIINPLIKKPSVLIANGSLKIQISKPKQYLIPEKIVLTATVNMQ